MKKTVISRHDQYELVVYEHDGITSYAYRHKGFPECLPQQYIDYALFRYVDAVVNSRFYPCHSKTWKDALKRRREFFTSVLKEVYNDIKEYGFI